LQQWARDQILARYPQLEPDDVRSCPMGSNGEDVQLSPAARKLFPYSIECKARKSFKTLYDFLTQAAANGGGRQPLVVLKQDRSAPLILIDAEYFFSLVKAKDD
jgi:hypothetical protein